MLVFRDARQRRARLALAPGGDRQHLVARQARERVGAEERRQAVEVTALARNRDDALHRATHHDDLTAVGEARFGGDAQPRDVRGEGRHDDAALGLAHEFGEAPSDVGLRGAFAFAEHVGGIADQREHALLAQRPQAGFIA